MILKLARNRIYKECAIVLLCFLMFGSLAHGAVLCLGPDGHVSIELKSTDCCDEYPGVPDSCGDANYSASTDSCGDCVDIPLSGSCVTKKPAYFAAKKPSPLKISPEAIISVSTNNSPSTSKMRIAKRAGHLSDTLSSIRTAVLII